MKSTLQLSALPQHAPWPPNSALVNDACVSALRAFFSAPQRERKDFPGTARVLVVMTEGRTASL
jgi:hypothetical protein